MPSEEYVPVTVPTVGETEGDPSLSSTTLQPAAGTDPVLSVAPSTGPVTVTTAAWFCWAGATIVYVTESVSVSPPLSVYEQDAVCEPRPPPPSGTLRLAAKELG